MRASHVVPLFLLLLAAGCGSKKGGEESKSASQGSASPKTAMDSLQQVPGDVQKVREATLLKFLFNKGDVFAYRIRSVTQVEEQTDTVRQTSRQDVAYTYRFEVLDADAAGNGHLRATCTEVVFRGAYGPRQLSYDSKAPSDKNQEKMFAQYNAPLNTPFEITVSPEGTVRGVSKVEKVVERLMGNDYKTSKADAKRQVAEDYGNNALKDIVQMAFQKLSEKPVATDSSWSITWDGAIGFLRVKNVGTYTLNGVKKEGAQNFAHIGIRMRSQYVGPQQVETGQGMATINQLDVKGTGKTMFDLDRHRTRSRHMEQELMTRITVDPPKELKDQMPNIGLIRMSQHATISWSIEAQ